MLSRHFDPFASLLDDWSPHWRGQVAPRPAVDVFEDEGTLQLRMEVPGLSPEDVNIEIEGDQLTVSGERKLENEDRRDGYHRIERSYGKFSRSFRLPNTVDGDGVEANMQSGILRLTFPKRPEARPRRIEVTSGGGERTISANAGSQPAREAPRAQA